MYKIDLTSIGFLLTYIFPLWPPYLGERSAGYLAIRRFEKDGRNVREWFAARNQFAIMFGERFDA